MTKVDSAREADGDSRVETLLSPLSHDRRAKLARGGASVGGLLVEDGPLVDTSVIIEMMARQRAIKAITEKASQLGWAGNPTGNPVSVAAGAHFRPYENCDIYYSSASGAHEIHGDIRAKYIALSGVSWLGLPTTDETATPDGVGRYNHFTQHGSIYWTPHTGPMLVAGLVRDQWQSQGWEGGPLGYPVQDLWHLTALRPIDHPDLAWSLFENGAIVARAGSAAQALTADVQPDALRGVVRRMFDERFHAQPVDIGLQPQVETLAIGEWSPDFWNPSPRLLTIRLHGFHDNGLAPDTDFELDVRLRFTLAWDPATPPTAVPANESLVVSLDWISVSAHGLASGGVANGVKNGVLKAFYRGGPDPDHPEVPDGAVFVTSFPTGVDQTGSGNLDVIDILTTAQGGLQVLLNPLPDNIGRFRQQVAQSKMDVFVAG